MSHDLSTELLTTTVEAIISEREPDGNLKPIENYVDVHTFNFPEIPKVTEKIQLGIPEEDMCYRVVEIRTLFRNREDSEGRWDWYDGIYHVIVEKLED